MATGPVHARICKPEYKHIRGNDFFLDGSAIRYYDKKVWNRRFFVYIGTGENRMKRGVAFVCVSALLAAFLAVRVPLVVMAAPLVNEYYLYNSSDPADHRSVPGVRQGDTSTDFIQAAPIATIYIDEAMIDTTFRRNEAEATLLTNTNPRAVGLRIGPVMQGSTENFGLNAGEKFLIFDNRQVADEYKIKPGQDNKINGDLASFRFRNAAETENGVMCDVIFTYSNLNIVLQSTGSHAITDADAKALESFSIAGGNLIQVAGTRREGARAVPSQTERNQRYGLTVDVNVKVVQSGTNNVVTGNFYFRIVDIDVHRNYDSFKSLYNNVPNDNYSEHIQLVNGFETSPHSVYIPGGAEDAAQNAKSGYKCEIQPDGSGGYMFTPTVSDSYPDADGSFYSGFLTVVDNSTGVNLRAWSAGCGNATVRTKLLAGFRTNTNIVYNVVSSTSRGGNIRTTTEGNPDKGLSCSLPGEQIIGPSKLMVSSGRDIIYTLTPDDPSCRPKEIIIDGKPYTGAELASLLGVTTVDFGTPSWVLESDILKNIQSDHTVHVNWEHKPKYSRLFRYSDRMKLPSEILLGIPPNSSMPEFEVGAMVPSLAPTQTTYTIDGFIYTFNGWQANELKAENSDVEFVGSWTITPVPVPVAATPPPADPGTSAFVPPPAPVEEAEEEEEVVEITEEEMLAAQLAVQKKMLSPETGDDAPVAALVFVMLLSGSICLLAARRKRRLK